MPRDDDSVTDILNSARIIADYIAGLEREDLDADSRTRDAIVLRLFVIGEATKRLSPEFRNAMPHVSWRKMAGMRDVLVHNYDQIDPQAVWDAATEDVPELISLLEALLPPPPEDP